jgi:hypothetical protein
MAVLMFEKQFWAAIFSGEKVHSIRPSRKRPISPGDSLSLRGWDGKPYRSKQFELCAETCIDVRPIWIDRDGCVIDGYDRIREPDELDQFARTDGFKSWIELMNYRDMFYTLPFSGDFIQWGPNTFLATKAIAFH